MTPEEFRMKVLPEGRRLYALAFRFLNNREEAEDAVQEVMMKLWAERNLERNYASPAAWCTTVTRNCCIDILRRRKRWTMEPLKESGGSDALRSGNAGADEKCEAAGLISEIVSRMKEPARSAVIMRDIEGYSYEETAEALESNVTAIRTVISRARKQIREEMEKIYRYGTGEDKRAARPIL
ncbi:MAG: sigma-70 family RNA polymerase sigma factor [Bacteroidales bacterium]|jgi:RNA polymerase sigma-70 factor (ECF subfamily)|nr:sigma-70 family RNA polymerase sigma factor [Bacteroidales bacterium]